MNELRDTFYIGWALSKDLDGFLCISQNEMDCSNLFGSDKEAADRVFSLFNTFIKVNTKLAELTNKAYCEIKSSDIENIGWSREGNKAKSLCDLSDNTTTERVAFLASCAFPAIEELSKAVEFALKAGKNIEPGLLDFLAEHNAWIDYNNEHGNIPKAIPLSENMNEEPQLCTLCNSPRKYIGINSFSNIPLAYCKLCETTEE